MTLQMILLRLFCCQVVLLLWCCITHVNMPCWLRFTWIILQPLTRHCNMIITIIKLILLSEQHYGEVPTLIKSTIYCFVGITADGYTKYGPVGNSLYNAIHVLAWIWYSETILGFQTKSVLRAECCLHLLHNTTLSVSGDIKCSHGAASFPQA